MSEAGEPVAPGGRPGADALAAALARLDPARLLGALTRLDRSRLSPRGRIDYLVALEHAKAAAEAAQLHVLADLAAQHDDGADPASGPASDPAGGPLDAQLDKQLDKQWVREEVACALRISAVTAADRLRLATELTTRLPRTVAALAGGQLSAAMSRHLAEQVVALPDLTARAVEKRALEHAGTQTFSQFARTVRRAVLAADPNGQDDRHAAALAERRVTHRPGEDGMGELWATLRADHAAASYAAIDHLAHQPSFDGDQRTIDQRRADALVTLLTGQPAHRPDTGPADTDTEDDGATDGDATGSRSTPGPVVQVTVALSTLLGIDDQPGELAGHGPIPAALARAIAADPTGTWRRLVTDPYGQLLDYGRTRYRPPTALADHVRGRDATCRFPTCNRQARHCELDHIVPRSEGGATNDRNLHPLCSRSHHLRHEAGWHVTRHPDGTTIWTAPTGHTYEKPPNELPIDTTMNPDDPDPPGRDVEPR